MSDDFQAGWAAANHAQELLSLAHRSLPRPLAEAAKRAHGVPSSWQPSDPIPPRAPVKRAPSERLMNNPDHQLDEAWRDLGTMVLALLEDVGSEQSRGALAIQDVHSFLLARCPKR